MSVKTFVEILSILAVVACAAVLIVIAHRASEQPPRPAYDCPALFRIARNSADTLYVIVATQSACAPAAR